MHKCLYYNIAMRVIYFLIYYHVKITGAHGTELPPPPPLFYNFLFTYLFSLFFFISVSFIYHVRVYISIQYHGNNNLHLPACGYVDNKSKSLKSIYTLGRPQVRVDRTLCCPPPFFFSFFFRCYPAPIFFSLTSIFFHINNILQLSMYHCMTYIQ